MGNREIKIGNDSYDCSALSNEQLEAFQSHLNINQRSAIDLEIEAMEFPSAFMLRLYVKLIRFYQKYLSKRLGNRCVMEPSCSHYSELAVRKYGVLKGIPLTIKRLCRCKPQNAGLDMP